MRLLQIIRSVPPSLRKNGPSVTMNRFNVNVKKAPKEEKAVPPAAQETKEETKG